MMKVTGMVQWGDRTYRIARLRTRLYEVTRLLDDAVVGRFFQGPPLQVMVASDVAADELAEIAHVAIRHAKTSWSALSCVRQAP